MAGYLPSLQTMMKGSLASVAGGAALGASLLWYGQNYLIYPSGFPQGSRQDIPTPLEYNMIYHDVTLETKDNIRIKAYLMLQRVEVPNTTGAYQQRHIYYQATKPDDGSEPEEYNNDMSEEDKEVARSRPTVLVFHANAGNLGHRLPVVRIFYDKMRCNVMILSYRGYGLSEGSPSESGLRTDAQTALDFLLDHPLLAKTNIILFGQSLGGAVSIDLASRNASKICALILENTFTSIPELIPSVMPYLSSVSFLCHQVWPSGESIRKIPSQTPMLLISGLRDEVVPPPHMKRLWQIVSEEEEKEQPPASEEAKSKEEMGDGRVWRKRRHGCKWWMEFVNGQHNNTCTHKDYWQEVAAFVAQYGN